MLTQRICVCTMLGASAALGPLGCAAGMSKKDYVQVRRGVMRSLAQSTSVHPPGVTLRGDDGVHPVFPTTLRGNYDWRGRGGFEFGLDCEQDYLSATSRGNTQQSTAAALLEHYFGSLEQRGLWRAGTPGGTGDYPTETAHNYWYLPENRIVVFGHVAVDHQSRRAYVTGWWVAD